MRQKKNHHDEIAYHDDVKLVVSMAFKLIGY
ncbi:hypothetical protein KPC_2704 [Acinetobacter stercoris]|uniref:Uncharacterized protein n=1 Tax=Acinetobacter stercoris TaxID=2126983 RepID=A0A2U3N1F4_9GAMM|nr:hypothetical protein KPC_2704 [Acinetobacter stercoris]